MFGIAAALIEASGDAPLIFKIELEDWTSVPSPVREFPMDSVLTLTPFPFVNEQLIPIERLPPMVKSSIAIVVTVPLNVRFSKILSVEVFKLFAPLPDRPRF